VLNIINPAAGFAIAFLWLVDNRGKSIPIEVDFTSSMDDESAGDPSLLMETWEFAPNEMKSITPRETKCNKIFRITADFEFNFYQSSIVFLVYFSQRVSAQKRGIEVS
jgi:hypothetical protein